jgi:hypothetical protein
MTRVGLVLLALGAIGGVGCGASGPSRTARLRDDLHAVLDDPSDRSDGARRVREALASAEESEAQGLAIEADEHASRARAWAEVDLREREVVTLEEQLGRLEAELLTTEAEASAAEHEAADRRAQSVAVADARAAEDELARALARAEADESAPRRARRVGLADGPVVRRMADVLADRARVLLAAAGSMGASPELVAATREVLESIESVDDPSARLVAADRAHGLARQALADARHRLGPSPRDEEIASLEEALDGQGFTALRDEHGLGARVTDLFQGTGLSPSARGRLRHLAEIVMSHPAGPIVLAVEADAGPPAQAEATRRLEALRRAIVGESAREVVVSVLVEVRAPGSATSTAPNAARVILPAYVPQAPTPLRPEAAASAGPGEASEPDSE